MSNSKVKSDSSLKRISPVSPLIPLPGTVDSSSSEIKTFKRCRTKWVFKYVFQRRREKSSRALSFGRLIHATFAHYYGNGELESDQMKEAFKLGYAASIPGTYDDSDRKLMHEGFQIFRRYVRFWDPDFDLLLPEIDFTRIPIFDFRFAGFVHGRLDGLTWIDDKLWIVDHKTGKKFTPKTFELDSQIDLYSLVGAKLFGKKFGGVMINYVRSYVSKKSLNYVRTKVIRSPRELTFIEANLARALRSMGSTTPTDLTFSFTKNCTWDCDYLSLCRRFRAGQTVNSYIKENFALRDRKRERTLGGEPDV